MNSTLEELLQAYKDAYDVNYNTPEEVESLLKTLYSHNITFEDWNTLITYLKNDKSLSNPTKDLLIKICEELDSKQDTLISGTNIKTINNQSLLGSGNINIQGGSDSQCFSTILIKSIDFEYQTDPDEDWFALPTKNIIIKSYPISEYIKQMVDEGKIAIRLNYRQRHSRGSHSKYNKNIFGYTNSYFRHIGGGYEKFDESEILDYENGLIHINSNDVKQNKVGDYYIEKVVNMVDFITDCILYLDRDIFTLVKYPHNDYLSCINVKDDKNPKGFVESFCNYTLIGSTRKRYTKFGKQIINAQSGNKRRFDYQQVIYGERSKSRDHIKTVTGCVYEYGYSKLNDTIVFPLTYARNYDLEETESFGIGSRYTLSKHLEFYQKLNNYPGVNLIYSNGERPMSKIRTGLYSTFSTSFCILKDDYQNERTYMYDATFPQFEKKVYIDFRPDYHVKWDQESAKYIDDDKEISFGIKIKIK